MKLITNEIKEKLLEADDENDKVIVKFFHAIGTYTFYALSGEETDDDLIMFGYVISPITPDFNEYGYVSLNELKSINFMERDLYLKENQTLYDLGVLS